MGSIESIEEPANEVRLTGRVARPQRQFLPEGQVWLFRIAAARTTSPTAAQPRPTSSISLTARCPPHGADVRSPR
jgi:hypothetical protein